MPDAPRHYRFAGFLLDTRTRELRGPGGAPVHITAKAFDTLCCLLAHRDRVVGKDELLATVWAGRVVEENNLTQAISALRRALGEAGGQRCIVTVPGRGYRFAAEVAEGAGDAGDGSVGPDAGAAAAAARPAGMRRAIVLGALLFGMTLFAIVAWRRDEPARSHPAAGPATTLAVLPFRSLSAGPRDDLLELGLAETLATRLQRAGALRVRPLAATQRLAATQPDALAAGRKLGATYVVAGSTQRVGDRVRVNARLLAVADGATVWADTFDTRLDRVFTLQDRMAGALARALALPPLPPPARTRSACDGQDPQAYRAWLRGHYLLYRPSRENLSAALAAFRRAIDLDTACTRAYADMALAYRGLAHTDLDPREMFALAKAATAQALALDPDSAEALLAQGRNRHLYDWDWAGAEASLKRAIELDPDSAEAHFGYAHLLIDLGRFEEGLAQARQARELDPLSPMINALMGGFLTAARQPGAARAPLQRALELQTEFWVALLVRGGIALDRGDVAAAHADWQRAAARSGRASQVLALLAVAEVASGRRAQAQAILRELQARDAAGYVPATSLAAVENALGHTEAALDLLERGYRERDIRMAFLGIDARWNNLRTQPRFRALARRLGLADGRAYGRY